MPSVNQATLLTGPGAGAIAVVRLAGEGVEPFLRRCFSRPVTPGRCVHGELRDGEVVVIDDPVVVLHESRQVADLSVHGGPWVVGRVMELAGRWGFEQADAREGVLPDVAVEGDTTLEREVLQHVPLARTELALRVLLAQPQAWSALWQRLAQAPPPREELERIAQDRSLRNLLRLPRVAIVGPPNVGKSTLANRLFAQERSITADLPGTTRDWVGEVANIDGLAVLLIDTPGQRQTPDPIERLAIEQSRRPIAEADLVVIVFDHSSPEPLVREMLDRYPNRLLVRNKADRPGPAFETAGPRAIPTTATTGAGVDALRAAILAHFHCGNLDPHRPRPFTHRHEHLLRQHLA